MSDLSVNRCLPSPASDFSDLQTLLSGDPGSEVVRGMVRKFADETNWEAHLGTALKAGKYSRFEVLPDTMVFADLIHKGKTFDSAIEIFPTLPLFDGKRVLRLDTLGLRQQPDNRLEVAGRLFVFGGETVVDITPQVMEFLGIEPEVRDGPLSRILQTLLQRLAEMTPEARKKAKEDNPIDGSTLRFVIRANPPENEPSPPLEDVSKLAFHWDEFPIGKSLFLKGVRGVMEVYPVPETHRFRLVASELGVESVGHLKEGCLPSMATNTRIKDLVLKLAPKNPENRTAGLTDTYLVGGELTIHSGGISIAGDLGIAPFEFDRAARVRLFDGKPDGDIKGTMTVTELSADSGLLSVAPTLATRVRGASLRDINISFEKKDGKIVFWNITARPKVRQLNILTPLDPPNSGNPSAGLLVSGLECGNLSVGSEVPDLTSLAASSCRVDRSTVRWGKELELWGTGDFDLAAKFDPRTGLKPVSGDLFWQGALQIDRDRMIGKARFNFTPDRIGYDLGNDGRLRVVGTLDRQTLEGPLTLSFITQKNGAPVTVTARVSMEVPAGGGFGGKVELNELRGRLTEDLELKGPLMKQLVLTAVKIPKGTPIVIPFKGFEARIQLKPGLQGMELRWQGKVPPVVFYVAAADGKTAYPVTLRTEVSASFLSGSLSPGQSEGALEIVDMKFDYELKEKERPRSERLKGLLDLSARLMGDKVHCTYSVRDPVTIKSIGTGKPEEEEFPSMRKEDCSFDLKSPPKGPVKGP